MIAIHRLHNAYHIAATGAARTQLARRLDHICGDLLTEALEAPARDFSDPNGPVFKIRKLKLRLWLNMAQRTDGQIAQDWAQLVARALHRQLAEGASNNMVRYPSQAAFLATWVLAVLDGVAQDRWMFTEFAVFDNLPAGRAVAAGLARHADHIPGVFSAISARARRDGLIDAFSARDIEALWTAWIGVPPRRGEDLPEALLTALPVTGIAPPTHQTGGTDARARTALRWLLALTQAPATLSVLSAAPLAMQLAQLSALFSAAPNLPALWRASHPPADAIRTALQGVPPDLAEAGAWAARRMAAPNSTRARQALAHLIDPDNSVGHRSGHHATARTPKSSDIRILTPFAGAALVIRSLRLIDPENRFDSQHRHHLMSGLFAGAQQQLAIGDTGLRQLSGLPVDTVLPPERAPDYDQDHRAMLDAFRRNVRGLQNASLAYLCQQFFAQPGRLLLTPDAIDLRIHSIPLKVLLQLAGRLGDQGPVPWLDNRLLHIEVGDG